MSSAAWRAYRAAADGAGIEVRELFGLDELTQVGEIFGDIWGEVELSADLLRAMAKAGGYISGVYVGDEIVGGLVGFHMPPEQRALHSHIAGVRAGLTGRSIGFALKLHQRAWALDRGISMIEWTYDPLIARNANFNLAKLAARAAEYLPNFYGVMGDDINGSEESDRILVHWELESPAVVEACAGRPYRAEVPSGAVASWVEVPTDIEGLRRTDPVQASEWRTKVRDQLHPVLTTGSRIAGFDRDRGYLVLPS